MSRETGTAPNDPSPGKTYPVGTILQLFPFEAMAKRGGGYNKAGHGWEFFKLGTDANNHTTIVQRGGAEVTNIAGSCQGCHLTGQAPSFDLVCEGHGAFPIPFSIETVRAIQRGDKRCAK